ncbi:saccharopine dehydrogenase family protein [Aliidiomarina quisquiliarum]|uniref:saccharopine dehydrogenase family protein n=1 Tax=Aliidiomarina quisquiliarum TaxID=2938947 RepID=UPI00208F55B4|nr:saccharopine dehydrogenase NADP-binding domain-containing protein [Aliidiomarina quisquiliarum]MCO4320470.1 saccharopine dehydrogenase NADP-binding domain-containing protein [Aliidiomarina quisquiliarum]
MKWMIYGAYGYTGELITHYAKRMGYSPVLAGRNKAKIESFANQVSLEGRVFDLSEEVLKAHLQDIDLVVHCAGPFEDTAEPMMKACIATGTHYLDITGEIEVFELAYSLRKEAEEAGIVLCPGVGFDVIPTDCIAARLKSQMPNATHLKLGFDTRSGISRGTTKTTLRRLGEGGAVRKNGEIIKVPLAYKTAEINFGDGKKMAMTIPWGDVSTAFYTTSVPNIEVYIPASPKLIKRLKWLNYIRWAMRLNLVRNWLANKADKQPAGPEAKEREKHTTWVWGEISNDHGDTIALREKVVNGYTLTSRGAVELAIYVLRNQLKPGFYTPSRLYGAKLIDRFLADK